MLFRSREVKLKKMLKKYGSQYDFSDDAFEPFFHNLYNNEVMKVNSPEPTFLEKLKKRFILKKQNEYQILSFFPDKQKYIAELSTITKNDPRVFLVSRNALSGMISRSVSSEAFFILVIAGLFILTLTFLLLGDVRLASVALIPVVSSVAGILGLFALLKISLTVPAIVAGIVVVGLSIDYGIFMVYRYKHRLNVDTSKAVLLSAVTTLIGAGVLLFSMHPILFYIGLTIVIGVSFGCVTSLVVVPSVYGLWLERGKGFS